jgi:hypothetical protein
MTRRTARALPLLALLLGSLHPPAAPAADGDLDSGLFRTPDGRWLGNAGEWGGVGAIDPDGVAVWAGSSGGGALAFAQVPASGTVSVCGAAVAGADQIFVSAALFDTAGRLVLVGRLRDAGLVQQGFVARFDYPECGLDGSFDEDGVWTWPGATFTDLRTVTVLTVGGRAERLLVGGYVGGPSTLDALLVRLRADGTLDTAFSDGDGFELFDLAGANDFLADLELDDAGRILLLAGSYTGSGQAATSDLAIARLTFDGALDSGFGILGVREWDPTGLDLRDLHDGAALVLRPDGFLVAATSLDPDGAIASRVTVTRLSALGFPQTVVTLPGSENTVVRDGLLQGDGKLVIAGMRNGNTGFAARLTAALAPDPSWAGGSLFAVHPVPAKSSFFTTLRLQAGRPLLFGRAWDVAEEYPLVARLRNAYLFADGFEWGNTRRW